MAWLGSAHHVILWKMLIGVNPLLYLAGKGFQWSPSLYNIHEYPQFAKKMFQASRHEKNPIQHSFSNFTVLYVVIVLKWTVHNNSTQFPPCYTPHPFLFLSLHPTHPLHPWTSAIIRISRRETKKWRIPVTFLNCCRHKQLLNSLYWPFTLWNMHNSNR